VKHPLKEPFTLSAGTADFTWVVEIDPDWWGKAGLRIVVDGPGFKDEVTGTPCMSMPFVWGSLAKSNTARP